MQKTKSPTRGKVLVVEDDLVASRALCRILRRFDFEVFSAANVREGVEQLDGQQFAIIDLNLPDGLGTDIIETIRCTRHPTRVAVASATTDPNLISDAERLGAEIILKKPIDLARLLQWLGASDPATPSDARR